MLQILFLECLLFIFTPNAAAPSQEANNLSSWEQTGIQALLAVKWNWETFPSGWKIFFHSESEAYLGQTNYDLKQIDIWVSSRQTLEQVAAIIAHEFAHVFDQLYLTDSLRREWLRARKIPAKTPWWYQKESRHDYRSGIGDFAECVSWTVQEGTGKFRSLLGPPPNKLQQALIRKWLSTLSKKKNL